ncbi:MAG: hypothetical protein Kow0056_00390 [Coriobacteriia bacterium]
MALRGNLRDFSLPDVFQLVAFSRKTGVLRIKGRDAEGTVWFREGEVFFAQSDWKREPLGQRMVASGRLTAAALGRALELQKSGAAGDKRLGQILVDEGYISEQVLETFVQEQIQDTVFDLMRWDEGEFDFEPIELPAEEDIGLSVSIENIIMEGSRRLEEWNRIKKKIPSMDIVFKMATAPGEGTFEISLKPTEWHLLLKVDGTRTVAELAKETGRTDFEVARILYGLFSAGLIEVASDDEVEQLRAERKRREERLEAIRQAQAEEEATVPEAVEEPEEPPAAEAPQAAEEEAAEAAVAEPIEEAPAETQPVPPAEEEREPEVPAFLAGEAERPTAEDVEEFTQMVEAVLDMHPVEETAAEEPPVEIAAEEPAVAEPVPPAPVSVPDEGSGAPPAPVVTGEEAVPAEIPVPDLEAEAAAEPAAEEPVEPEAEAQVEEPALDQGLPEWEAALGERPSEAAEAAEVVEAEEAAEEETPEPAVAKTGDLEADLRAMGLGEPPVELAEPMGAEPVEESLTIVEPEPEPPAEEPGEVEMPELEEIEAPEQVADSSVLGELLTKLEGETPAEEETAEEPLETVAGLEEPVVEPQGVAEAAGLISTGEVEGEPPTEGVISTDAFLSDIEIGTAVGLSSGIGDELTALTGAESRPARPQATVNKIPDEGEAAGRLQRDMTVDADLVKRIIEGIERL